MTDHTLLPPAFDPADAAAAAARFAATAPADVAYAVVDSPVGTLVAARTERGLARLAYEDYNGGVSVQSSARSKSRRRPSKYSSSSRLTSSSRAGASRIRGESFRASSSTTASTPPL